MEGICRMPMKMKAKLLFVFSVGALMMVFLVDFAEGRRLSQLPESECDFDFKEQPEDFFGLLDSPQVSEVASRGRESNYNSTYNHNRCRQGSQRSKRMTAIN